MTSCQLFCNNYHNSNVRLSVNLNENILATIDLYYLLFWNITNNFSLISIFTINGGNPCQYMTWSSQNLLRCVEGTYSYSFTVNPILNNYIRSTFTPSYPINSMIYYPFSINSDDIILSSISN